MQRGVWRKGSMSSSSSGCIEVMWSEDGNKFLVRDSKLGDASPILEFNSFEALCFLTGAKDGEFDEPTTAA